MNNTTHITMMSCMPPSTVGLESHVEDMGVTEAIGQWEEEEWVLQEDPGIGMEEEIAGTVIVIIVAVGEVATAAEVC